MLSILKLWDVTLLPLNPDSGAPAWISPWPEETEPNPPEGYIVSLMRLHERGFGLPVGRFMQALCDYYGLELHNFGPNSISQAAVFVAVCEGYLGIEAHWDLWIHLFRREIFVEHVRNETKRYVCRRPDAPLASQPEEFVHLQQDDNKQRRVVARVVLPAQLQ